MEYRFDRKGVPFVYLLLEKKVALSHAFIPARTMNKSPKRKTSCHFQVMLSQLHDTAVGVSVRNVQVKALLNS